MKTKDGEVGTYNPYRGEYESVLSSEEQSEVFNEEHKNDEREEIGIDPTGLNRGELLPESEQPDTWDPISMTWKKAGEK